MTSKYPECVSKGPPGCYGYEWLSWNVRLHENSQSSELNNLIIIIIILIIMWPKKTIKLWYHSKQQKGNVYTRKRWRKIETRS